MPRKHRQRIAVRPASRTWKADPRMHCPACARPVAMARAKCVYCGAPLSDELLASAALAAERVLRSKSLTHLEATAQGLSRDAPARRYLVIDTGSASAETLARTCSISVWEARQWQAAARYRLLRITTEPPDGPAESGFRQSGLTFFSLPGESLASGRTPLLVESIDLSATPHHCTFREDAEPPPAPRALPENEVILIVSGSIRRERVSDQPSRRARALGARLDDAFLVHLHLMSETRPWEIDPRHTGFEGAALASAHVSTRDLVRRLADQVPHDEAFRNLVPALSPGSDEPNELAALKKSDKDAARGAKLVVLDNLAQFRDYSAWRGAIEREMRVRPRG